MSLKVTRDVAKGLKDDADFTFQEFLTPRFNATLSNFKVLQIPLPHLVIPKAP
jgi:hypothetical protein